MKKNIVKDNSLFMIVLLSFAIYYLYRMFWIAPWYDEVYTYLNFIDKGVIYSATHWPAPNNHVFFSMVSSLLRGFGIYIGLRGVSYLAALGTLIVLYLLFKKTWGKNFASFGCIIYGSLLATNSLAVQGRGYSLATFFLILSIYCGYCICFEKSGKKIYILWIISLWLGLYTLVSSVYWVVSICICNGILLLILSKYKELIKLIIASLIAALMTLVSYAILWFSVGAQLISNDISTGYFGAKISDLIVQFPRTCLVRGMDFMLSDRSVQGIDRAAFIRDFRFFARDVLSGFWGEKHMAYWYVLLVSIVILTILFVALGCYYKKNKQFDKNWLYPLVVSGVGYIMMYIVLLVQSAYPFARVFSYLGIYLAISICVWMDIIRNVFKKLIKKSLPEKANILSSVVPLILLVMVLFRITTPMYLAEYDYMDYYAYDAIKNIDWSPYESFYATDVYANQQIMYHCIEGEEMLLQTDMNYPDVLFVSKNEMNGQWPYYITNEQLAKYCIEERELLYENTLYLIYGK